MATVTWHKRQGFAVVFSDVVPFGAHLAVCNKFYLSALFFFNTVLLVQEGLPIQLGRAEVQLIM